MAAISGAWLRRVLRSYAQYYNESRASRKISVWSKHYLLSALEANTPHVAEISFKPSGFSFSDFFLAERARRTLTWAPIDPFQDELLLQAYERLGARGAEKTLLTARHPTIAGPLLGPLCAGCIEKMEASNLANFPQRPGSRRLWLGNDLSERVGTLLIESAHVRLVPHI